MKKFFLMAAFCLVALSVSAEIRFKSIDNIKATNIVLVDLVDNGAPHGVEVTDAVLFSDGKEYPAKQIRCEIADSVAYCKLKFKRLTVFKDCKVTLTVNGKKVVIDIQKAISSR